MSRRYADNVYEERDRERDYYPRPRQDRNYEDLEVDIRESRAAPPRRAPPVETLVSDRRASERIDAGPRRPDFLREDYGATQAGPLVVRERREEDDYLVRSPRARRGSMESQRSKAREDREEIDIRIREREGRGASSRVSRAPRAEFRDVGRDEIVYDRQVDDRMYRNGPQGRQPLRERTSNEEIDIRIRHEEGERAPPPPRVREEVREVEEVNFRRGLAERPRLQPPRADFEEKDIDIRIREREASRGPPPSRRGIEESDEIDIRIREREQSRGPPPSRRGVVEQEDIDIRIREHEHTRGPPPQRGREERDDIDIRIRETESSRQAPQPRSMSRGTLVRREEEEWVVRRKKARSPTPPPPPSPPRDYEKQEIIIRRRKERTPSPEPIPEPPRMPTPEPLPPPVEPIYERPIIREVITHHRHIDHGIERVRSPTPPPAPMPPSPPSPAKEENLDIEIRRRGVRNGKAFEEDINIDLNDIEGRSRSRDRGPVEPQALARRESRSRVRGYDDEIAAEAAFYNRKAKSRGYPGEAYNGATRDWGLVDIPPGTERVKMDGVGGGSQEITWQRYNGDRQSKFRTDDRLYESPRWDQGYTPSPRSVAPPPPAPAPLPPPPREDKKEEIDIRISRNERDVIATPPRPRERRKEKMWTEITKDLVIKEAVDEMGYQYEETDDFFYVIDYLRYEDVLRLVELTEDIRRERRERLREIQWEREERDRMPKLLPPAPAIPPPPMSDYYQTSRSPWAEETIHEREYYRDRDGRRYR